MKKNVEVVIILISILLLVACGTPAECDACETCETCEVCEVCEEQNNNKPEIISISVEEFILAVEDENFLIDNENTEFLLIGAVQEVEYNEDVDKYFIRLSPDESSVTLTFILHDSSNEPDFERLAKAALITIEGDFSVYLSTEDHYIFNNGRNLIVHYVQPS